MNLVEVDDDAAVSFAVIILMVQVRRRLLFMVKIVGFFLQRGESPPK